MTSSMTAIRPIRWISSVGLSMGLATACVERPPPSTAPRPEPATEPVVEASEPKPRTERAEAPLPEAQAVLDRATEALGGRDAWQAIDTYYCKGTLEVSGQGLRTVIEIWWQSEDFYMRSDMENLGISEVWKKGDAVWVEDPQSGRRQVQAAEARQLVEAASLSIVVDWRRYYDAARTLGRRAADGRALLDVELSSQDGAALTVSFDEESGLPVSHATRRDTPLGTLLTTTAFEDYREVSGIQLPFRSVIATPTYESVMRVERFDLGVTIDPGKFTP